MHQTKIKESCYEKAFFCYLDNNLNEKSIETYKLSNESNSESINEFLRKSSINNVNSDKINAQSNGLSSTKCNLINCKHCSLEHLINFKVIQSHSNTFTDCCCLTNSNKMNLTSLNNCRCNSRHFNCNLSIQNKSSFKLTKRSSAIDDEFNLNKLTKSFKSSYKSPFYSSNRTSNSSSISNSFSIFKLSSFIRILLSSLSKSSINFTRNHQSLLVPLLLVLCTVIRISGKFLLLKQNKKHFFKQTNKKIIKFLMIFLF